MKKILSAILTVLALTALLSCGRGTEAKYKIVTTVFPAYDAARAVTEGAEDVEVTMLLPPGSESHDYEPSLEDIALIGEADLFITVGGETDKWTDGVLETVGHDVPMLRLTDCTEHLDEAELEGMEEEHGEEEEDAFDEHVWTTPSNMAAITLKTGEELSRLIPEYAEAFAASAEKYASGFEELSEEYSALAENKKRDVLIFADRFPFRYLAEEMGLECFAAFSGCSSDSEPALSTIYFLTEKAKEEGVKTVLTIEFSHSGAADVIAREAGAEVRTLHSCHNVSKEDFGAGVTCLDLMKGNLDVLKAALGGE